jgi:hypothetical protein
MVPVWVQGPSGTGGERHGPDCALRGRSLIPFSLFNNLYNIRIEVHALWVARQIGYRARPLLSVASSDVEDVREAFAN